MTENFSTIFEAHKPNYNLKSGDTIKANVIAIDRDYVTLDVGLKSEGLVPLSEFRDLYGTVEINIGDEVDVVLDNIEDGYGGNILSREKAKKQASWIDLTNKYHEGLSVFGVVTGKVKGGFTVDVNQVKAFLPGSLVDVRPVKDPKFTEGQEIEFKIIKMDLKRNNIVVSRKALLESENMQERSELLFNLEDGQVTTGIVKNLTDYGAFIDLGGVDGLLHITDISWKRIKHPSEVLNIGDEISVKVLRFDKDKNRVSLGMKQLGDDPWLELIAKYPLGSQLSGEVTNITDYGCFIEIENGVEGLVHMSEMDWTNKNIHPGKLVSLGDSVNVKVLEVDHERRRISLGMKQCIVNPWVAYAEQHKKGEKIKGTIKSITDFGIFIGLSGDIDGLVHLSDIAWDDSGENVVKNYAKGQEIEAVVLSIDPDRERVSLGIKQLKIDTFSEYLDANPKGTIVNASVLGVEKTHALLALAEGVKGEIKAVELSSEEKITDARNAVKVGDSVEAKIVHIDRKNKIINLSVKAKDEYEEATALQNYKQSADDASVRKLGDIFKEQISDNNS